MNFQPSLHHLEAYVAVHGSHTGPGFHDRPSGPFVTISRETGTGVSAFANALATRLDQALPGEKPWTVFDGNLVESMLESRQLSPFMACYLPEDQVSEFQSTFGEILGLHPSLWELVHRTNDMMRKLAHAGHVILVGRGANLATNEVAHGVHLRLVAPKGYRAEHKSHELAVPVETAAARNLITDEARRKYVRSVFSSDIARAAAYDLVVNVSRIPVTALVELTLDLLARQVPVPAD